MNVSKFHVVIAAASLVLTCRAQDGMLGFMSANSFVSVASTPDLMPQGGLTVESWFYFDPAGTGGSNNPTIIRKDASQHPYILRTNSGGGGHLQWIVWTQGGGYTNMDSPGLTPLLSWHHLAGTYDGAVMRMYLDGVQVASTPKTGLLLVTAGALELGTGQDPGETWKGNIDEVRIWSTVRSASEIQSTRFQRLDSQPGLVAAWHFDGNYADLTGGHNGTPVNAPLILPSTSPVLSVFLTAPPLAPIGASLPFQLFAAPFPAPYILEVSVTGSSPGTPIPSPGTGVFPLNPPFLNSLYGGLLSSVFQNFQGLTNGSGHANAVLNIPGNPVLGGLTISAAFVVLDGAAPYGIGKISNATQTVITGYAPQVTAVTPPTGPTVGGWAVTITGMNFQPGAAVTFDGVPATSVVATPTSITCFTPSGPLGASDVVVQNPDGNQASLVNGFTYVPTLAVTSASPIVAGPGTMVTVSGAGFTGGLSASLGGIPVTIGAVAPASFTFVVPPGSFCTVPFVVSLLDGQTGSLTMNPSPTITGVVGPPGNPAGGSSVFVLGSNFHPGTTLTIGGAAATIVSMSTTVILLSAPPGQSGPAPLIATSAAGCSAASTYVYQ